MDIEKIKKERSNAQSIFTKFTKNRELFNKKMFCFFEGEDRKYYGSRIEEYANIPEEEIIFYSCSGKEQVLKLYKMLKNKYMNVQKMFFVDKDYDNIECEKELYVTPGYSIENFYVTENAFKKILHKEFGINTIDKDFNKCLNNFNDRKEEFNSQIIKLNGWLYYQKEQIKRKGVVYINYQNFKLNKIFDISINKLVIKTNINTQFLKKEYTEAYEINDEELNKYTKIFDKEEKLRGKYQLEFFKAILQDMIEKNRNREYFEYFRNNIGLNPSVNTLSSLSAYAETPECLKQFLHKYRNFIK